jgi:hypothetical protein
MGLPQQVFGVSESPRNWPRTPPQLNAPPRAVMSWLLLAYPSRPPRPRKKVPSRYCSGGIGTLIWTLSKKASTWLKVWALVQFKLHAAAPRLFMGTAGGFVSEIKYGTADRTPGPGSAFAFTTAINWWFALSHAKVAVRGVPTGKEAIGVQSLAALQLPTFIVVGSVVSTQRIS